MGKQRVLVVDDELDNRVMMRYFLESWGYEVELAANGQEALEKVEKQPPQLVLLDLEMPIMNGFETCDRLKSNEATEHIPVIMFTGLEQTSDKVKGIRKGADDYVVKTVDPEELQARIEMILRRAERYEAQPPAGNGDDAPVPSGDSHAVSGSLAELYFPETMQLIMAYGKTGVLHLKDGEREGRVYLKEGQVVHAELGDQEGEEAFYDLALWKQGHFSFQVGETPSRTTIDKSGTNLLIEATRRVDEWNMISTKIKSFELCPVRVPLSGAQSIRLSRKDWKILLQLDGRSSIRQVAERLGADLFETGRMLFNLITVGVVSVDVQVPPEPESYDEVPLLAPDPGIDEPFELSAEQWRLISRIDGRRSVGTLAGLLGVPARALMAVLRRLEDQGLVRFTQARSSSPTGGAASGGKPEDTDSMREQLAAFRPRIRAIGFD